MEDRKNRKYNNFYSDFPVQNKENPYSFFENEEFQ